MADYTVKCRNIAAESKHNAYFNGLSDLIKDELAAWEVPQTWMLSSPFTIHFDSHL